MTITFCGHIVACMFQYLAIYEIQYLDQTTSWMIQYGVAEASWLYKYLSALHFSVTTMVTVGYGDITPKTIYETAFVILAMIVSCGIFAYTFNSVGSIIDGMTRVQFIFYLYLNLGFYLKFQKNR